MYWNFNLRNLVGINYFQKLLENTYKILRDTNNVNEYNNKTNTYKDFSKVTANIDFMENVLTFQFNRSADRKYAQYRSSTCRNSSCAIVFMVYWRLW